MNIQRFQAATLREALAKARRTFGEGTLILSNRTTPGGVEVVATAEDALASLEADHPPEDKKARRPAQRPTSERALERSGVEQDTERLAMSTLSFQDYVRERMLAKRHERGAASTAPARSASPALVEEDLPPPPARRRDLEADLRAAPREEAGHATPQRIFHQLNAMQQMIEDRLGAMAWLGQARQHPIQSNLLLKLVRAGFSPELSRKLLDKMPAEVSAGDSVRHVMKAIAQGVKTDEGASSLVEEGGMFALMGPTGVGKTSTATKLVARCLSQHGAGSVGLISLDTHRAGAHEQLRASARTLGVVAHMAHDRAALQELLSLLGGKKMVVIDTAGYGPQDSRIRDAINLASLPGIKHLLALSAVAHGDAVDATIQAYRTPQMAGALLCKADEAVKLGPVLDAVIRNGVKLRGVCTGQRIAEDLVPANAADLVRLSMRSLGRSAYDPSPDDLALYFTGTTQDAAQASWSPAV